MINITTQRLVCTICFRGSLYPVIPDWIFVYLTLASSSSKSTSSRVSHSGAGLGSDLGSVDAGASAPDAVMPTEELASGFGGDFSGESWQGKVCYHRTSLYFPNHCIDFVVYDVKLHQPDKVNSFPPTNHFYFFNGPQSQPCRSPCGLGPLGHKARCRNCPCRVAQHCLSCHQC